jgi:hypothetical protein
MLFTKLKILKSVVSIQMDHWIQSFYNFVVISTSVRVNKSFLDNLHNWENIHETFYVHCSWDKSIKYKPFTEDGICNMHSIATCSLSRMHWTTCS